MNAKCGANASLDLTVDPPPDLAIEVDISRSSIDKLGIYADLGVPELWFYDGQSLVVRRLQRRPLCRAGYERRISRSLDLKEVERFIGRVEQSGEIAWIRSFRDWVKASYGHLAG